jgi:hypothetical protein
MCGMDGCRPEETVFDHGLRAPHGGHARSFSQRPAHLYHASPRRPQETRHRSISSLERRLEAVTSLTPRAPEVTHPRDPRRRHGAVCLVAERRILAQRDPADDHQGPARGNRNVEPHDDAAPYAPSWPRFPGSRDKRCPTRRCSARYILVPPMGSVTIALTPTILAVGRFTTTISTT